MALSTAIEVLALLPPTTALTEVSIEPHLLAAACIISAIADGCASDVGADCLKMAEMQLAAHFASASDYSLNKVSESDACSEGEIKYGWKLGEGIKGTPYGQMADLLVHGCLAEREKQADKVAATNALGLYSIGCH